MKTPSYWYIEKSWISSVLLPLSYFWLLLSFFRNTFKKKYFFKIPIICVGNVLAGGAGKTPLVIEICKYYKKKKINIHVVYKVYKNKIDMNVLNVNQSKNDNLDDEAILISKYANTWLCKKRKYGINAAIKAGANLIILDDGLQDVSIKKDINILVSNENQGNGNNKIIPAGPLREPVATAIKKSNCLFFYGEKSNINKYFKNYKNNIFCGEIKIDKQNIINLNKRKVIAFAGIAHPNNFFKTLNQQGVNIIDTLSFPDHFKYQRNDINKILLKCKTQSAIPITTYKDYVKIPDDLKKNFSVVKIHITFDKSKFFNFINNKINLYV